MMVGSTEQSGINDKLISQSDFFVCALTNVVLHAPPPLGGRPSLFHTHVLNQANAFLHT